MSVHGPCRSSRASAYCSIGAKCGLMMAVAGMHAAKIVNHDVWSKSADDAHHIGENLIAPNFFCLLRSFRETEVFSTGKKEFYAVAACSGQQLLRSNKSKLRSLLGTEHVLAAFTASERQQGDIGVQAASQIGEHRSGLVVGMRSDIQNAGGDARAVDGFDGFVEARAGARSGCKLREERGCWKKRENGNCEWFQY